MATLNSEPSPQPRREIHQPVAHVNRRESHDSRIDGYRLPTTRKRRQHDLVVEKRGVGNAAAAERTLDLVDNGIHAHRMPVFRAPRDRQPFRQPDHGDGRLLDMARRQLGRRHRVLQQPTLQGDPPIADRPLDALFSDLPGVRRDSTGLQGNGLATRRQITQCQ